MWLATIYANRLRLTLTVLVLVAQSLAPIGAFAECSRSLAPLEPTVSTIAGIGSPGIANGMSLKEAQFIEPSGVAVGPDGAIYVADSAAQNIRKIYHGVVSTFAGTSTPGEFAFARVGGYLDGPSNSAKFNNPRGLAIGKDGSVYVADSLNRAIRVIRNGVVTTLTRSLDDPYALALDDDGVLFVADYGTGIRTVARDGTLSAMDSIGGDHAVCGVAVSGRGDNRMLAYTDSTGIRVRQGSVDRSLAYDGFIDPIESHHSVGRVCNLVILNRDTLVAADEVTNSVKFVRLAIEPPTAAPATVRVLASGERSASSPGGFLDGLSSVAQTDVPRQLALAANGDIILADSGNRRVRKISGIDARGPVAVNQSGTLSIPDMPRKDYRVVVIGNSYTFTNVMWSMSIAGNIERSLDTYAANSKSLSCSAIAAYRLSAASVTDLSDFIETYYADGQADLVVFIVDSGNVNKDIIKLLKDRAAKENSTNIPDPNSIASETSGWKTAIPARLSALEKTLRKSGTKMALVFVPDGQSISTLENVQAETIPGPLRDFYTTERAAFLPYTVAREYEQVLGMSGVHMIGLLHPLIAQEQKSTRAALFESLDPHPSPAGSIAIGNLIGEDLIRWKPWMGESTR